jgi:hypothetical protein
MFKTWKEAHTAAVLLARELKRDVGIWRVPKGYYPSFYACKDERPGTRITFNDGGGFAVAEPYETVKERLSWAMALA